jgi:hypothetical protein
MKVLAGLHQRASRDSHVARKRIPQVAMCHDGLGWVDFTLDPPLQMTVRPSINAANFRIHKRFAVAG